MRIPKRLTSLAEKLKNQKRQTLLGGNDWNDNVPPRGGVYVIWSKPPYKPPYKPIYVGETCHLKHRFSDFGKKHSFRRKMAKKLGLINASEETLTKELSKQFSISFLEVDLGRKELEEYLIILWERTEKTIINKPPKRLLLSEPYKSNLNRLKFMCK